MSVLYALLIVALQAASGAFWWALASGRRKRGVSVFELVGVGTALGAFVSMVVGIALVETPLAPLAPLLPVVATLVLMIALRQQVRSLRVRLPRTELVAVAVGLAAGLVIAVGNWRRIPLENPTTDSFTDLYFFEALGRGLAHWGPQPSILMTDGSLRYHWFTYAWAGQLERLADTVPFMVLTRVVPLVVLVGIVTLAAAWAGRLTKVRWVPTLAVLLIVVGSYSGALYGSILNYDSPSQAMTTLWLLALAVVTLAFVESTANRWSMVLVALLAAACTGGKISHAVVAAAGFAAMTLIGLVTRQPWGRRALVATAVAGLAMAATYVLVLSGVAVDRNLSGEVAIKASTWQGLDPFAGPLGVALGTIALASAVAARWAGFLWLVGRRRWRCDPAVLFVGGGMVAGLLAMLLLSQGVNELWFALAASAPAAVLSAHGVGIALSGARRRAGITHPLVVALIVAAPASLAALILSRNWSTHQNLLNWLAPVSVWLLVPLAAAVAALVLARPGTRVMVTLALAVSALTLTSIATRPSALWTSSRPVSTVAGTITPDGVTEGPTAIESPAEQAVRVAFRPASFADAVDASAWILRNLPPNTVLATGWPVSALVPALTGYQMYIAGNVYQAGLGAAENYDQVFTRSDQSLAFLLKPSADSARPLCRAGIEWVWLDRPQAAIPQVADVAYANAGVTIMRLLPQSCS